MSEARVISPRVTMIPATRERFTSMPIHHARKRRVAAYARVSTRDEEQRNSYEAQVDHYTRYIQNNAEWGIRRWYADRGITGTSTKKREHFNDMIEDALAGNRPHHTKSVFPLCPKYCGLPDDHSHTERAWHRGLF